MSPQDDPRLRPREDPGSDRAEAELAVAHEIADSFLRASSPLQVYRIALARVTPRVGASFASVFLRSDEDPELLRLTCAHNWPQASARHLARMRIRTGRGPSGRAVSENRPVEVVDVFDDPSLEDWWEPARELSFVSMIALPLTDGDSVLGALSFYFRQRREFSEADRSLLGVVAHQLAATARRDVIGPGTGTPQ